MVLVGRMLLWLRLRWSQQLLPPLHQQLPALHQLRTRQPRWLLLKALVHPHLCPLRARPDRVVQRRHATAVAAAVAAAATPLIKPSTTPPQD
eukprot:COSAG01_NODE_65073_length_274_cov_0.880000_1_plen_91_part_11